MLSHVYKLVFGAGEEAYSGLLELFSTKNRVVAGNVAMRVERFLPNQ